MTRPRDASSNPRTLQAKTEATKAEAAMVVDDDDTDVVETASTAAAPGGVKSKRHTKSGRAALREIRSLQRTTDLLLPNATMARNILEALQDVCTNMGIPRKNIKADAVKLLHAEAEVYVQDMFRCAYDNTIHSKRIQLSAKDMHRAKRQNYKWVPPNRQVGKWYYEQEQAEAERCRLAYAAEKERLAEKRAARSKLKAKKVTAGKKVAGKGRKSKV